MPRFPEQRLWDRIRRNVQGVSIERIENSLGGGTPDTLVLYKSKVLFVEHKSARRPAKLTTRVQWRHELTAPQRNWHLMWHQNGGRSLVIVDVDKELHALPGCMVDLITAMPYCDMALWRVDYAELMRIYKGLVVR